MKFLPLIWSNLVRNKLRTALTAGAIALAVALVCLLLTMPGGLDRILNEIASNTRVVVLNEAGLVYPLPYSYLQKVRAMEGVVDAASWTWYGGVFREEKGVEFPNFAVEPEPIGVVWEDWGIAPEQLEAFRRYRDGAIVGRGTLVKQGWKVGDRIALKGTVYPVDLEFQIVGEIPDEQAPHLWFQREYLDQALRASGRGGLDQLGTIWVRVDDPEQVGPLMARIDAAFRNSEAETTSETEKSYFANFVGQLEGFVTVILIVTGLVALCIVFIAANTASMAVRERMREIAVLKALGFSRRLVFATPFAEATLLSTLGGVL
ncbi:MAG TPA: ABC transporter permease, partial [Myxococcota bacterium]|nr:ABC transporter permease [Myxococcota bacterium]